MKKKKFKRFYALVLSICLVGGILPNIFQPISVKAAEEEQTAEIGGLAPILLPYDPTISLLPSNSLDIRLTSINDQISLTPLNNLDVRLSSINDQISLMPLNNLDVRLSSINDQISLAPLDEPEKPIPTEPADCFIRSYRLDVAAVTTFGCEVPAVVSAWRDNKSGRTTVTTEPVPGYNFVGWFNYSEGYGVREDEMIYTGESLSKNLSYTFSIKEDTNLVAVYEPL